MEATERLYLAADKETVVLEGDPRAAWHLVSAGKQIPAEHEKSARAALDARTTPEPEPAKTAAKSADKAAKAGEDKGSGSGLKVNRLPRGR